VTGTPEERQQHKVTQLLTGGHYQDLRERKINESTCKKWKYQVGELENGKPCHIANYYNEHGRVVFAQKIRFKKPDGTKGFAIRGAGQKLPLYGMWLWRDGGKSVTITEGEIDALSVSQCNGLKWPVVSLPNGAQSAAETLKQHIEWLDRFESIVLCFDMDNPGREAIEKAVEVLPVGKVKVMNLPEKDANETLIKHGPQAVVDAFWNARVYSPAGIVSGADLALADLMAAATKGYTLRTTPVLNDKMLGLRKGEITLLTAGSGIGKSTLLRQGIYELHQAFPKLRFGNVYLEENNVKTMQAYIALHNSVPLGRLRFDPTIISEDRWKTAYDALVNRMWFYNHFGSVESKKLISKLRYMVTACGVDFIALDHISIVTSGLESSSEGERKDIDILMTNLRSLVEETGVGVLGVVHLKRVQGKNFNEGAQVSLTDLRGSAGLEQLSDNVIALERDQQDEEKANSIRIRILKCRETGDVGEADLLEYNRQTGKLVQADTPVEFKPIVDEEAEAL
jgi:twinkle protein